MAGSEIAQTVMDANTVTTIANNLNSLYSNAISQLTAYTLGVVALVGIVIPLLVTLIQWRSLKAEKENLERHITEEIRKAKTTIRDELIAELMGLIKVEENTLFSDIKKELEELRNKLECANAASFHLQGNGNAARNLHPSATVDYCVATIGYLGGKDELNGQTTLKLIIDCLPKINKSQYDQFELEEQIAELITYLEKINQNDRYTAQIRAINRERKEAKAREIVSAVSSS